MLSFRRIKTAFLGPFTLSIPLGFRPVKNVFISCKCLLIFISIYSEFTYRIYNTLFHKRLNCLSSQNNFDVRICIVDNL